MGQSAQPQYTNRRGEKVSVRISSHAIERYEERYELLTGEKPDDAREKLIREFNSAVRVLPRKASEIERWRRYGKDTVYFRRMSLTFVVQNRRIVTVEISARGKRHLNRGKEAGGITYH